MWNPLHLRLFAVKRHCNDIEHAFVVAVRNSLPAVQEAKCSLCDAGLLLMSDIFLWSCLNIILAGLHFYKMYSIFTQGDDIYFQMSASPVPCEYGMSKTFKVSACDLFSRPT